MSTLRGLLCTCGALAALSSASWAQKGEGLIYPIDRPPEVTSTLGTYRFTHHHAGLDLTTSGDETAQVLAVKAGLVYRLKRGHSGYGRAVYVRHADGTQAVYGHLSSFAEPLRALILERERKAGGAYTLAFNLPAPIPVEQGQILGTVGTSGTDLVHLHFELRDSGVPVNPLTRGLPVPDTQAPRIEELLLIPMDPAGRAQGAHDELSLRFPPAEGGLTRLEEPITISGDVRLFVRAPDRIDGSERDLAPYQVQLFIDGKRWHETRYDQTSYSDKRYTELDFEPGRNFAKEGMFHRLTPQGPRVRQHLTRGKSLSKLKRGLHKARIEVADAAGNRSRAEFTLRVEAPQPPCALAKGLPAEAKGDAARWLTPDLRREWRDDLLIVPLPGLCEGGSAQVTVRLAGKRLAQQRWTLTRLAGEPALAVRVGDTQPKGDLEIGWRVPAEAPAEGSARPSSRWVRLSPFAVRGRAVVDRVVDGRPLQFALNPKGSFWPYMTEVWALPELPASLPLAGLSPQTPGYAFGNTWVPGQAYHSLRIGVDDALAERPHLGMYVAWKNRVLYGGNTQKEGFVRGAAVHLATLFLAQDVADPVVGEPVLEDHPGGRRLIVPISDEGSGLAKATLHMDGQEITTVERQMAMGRLVWMPLEPPAAGPKRFEVHLEDRSGRQAQRSFELVW